MYGPEGVPPTVVSPRAPTLARGCEGGTWRVFVCVWLGWWARWVVGSSVSALWTLALCVCVGGGGGEG